MKNWGRSVLVLLLLFLPVTASAEPVTNTGRGEVDITGSIVFSGHLDLRCGFSLDALGQGDSFIAFGETEGLPLFVLTLMETEPVPDEPVGAGTDLEILTGLGLTAEEIVLLMATEPETIAQLLDDAHTSADEPVGRVTGDPHEGEYTRYEAQLLVLHTLGGSVRSSTGRGFVDLIRTEAVGKGLHLSGRFTADFAGELGEGALEGHFSDVLLCQHDLLSLDTRFWEDDEATWFEDSWQRFYPIKEIIIDPKMSMEALSGLQHQLKVLALVEDGSWLQVMEVPLGEILEEPRSGFSEETIAYFEPYGVDEKGLEYISGMSAELRAHLLISQFGLTVDDLPPQVAADLEGQGQPSECGWVTHLGSTSYHRSFPEPILAAGLRFGLSGETSIGGQAWTFEVKSGQVSGPRGEYFYEWRYDHGW